MVTFVTRRSRQLERPLQSMLTEKSPCRILPGGGPESVLRQWIRAGRVVPGKACLRFKLTHKIYVRGVQYRNHGVGQRLLLDGSRHRVGDEP
jgi:hypothetical protein